MKLLLVFGIRLSGIIYQCRDINESKLLYELVEILTRERLCETICDYLSRRCVFDLELASLEGLPSPPAVYINVLGAVFSPGVSRITSLIV